MKKRGINKRLLATSVIFILLLSILITAEKDDLEKIRDKIASSVSDKADKIIWKLVEKKGIDIENITNVTEINFENLPSGIKIGNAENSSISFYQITFEDAKKLNKVFVVSYSPGGLRLETPFVSQNITFPSTGTNETSHNAPDFLEFEFKGEMNRTGFLESVTGIEGSIDKGYIMIEKGNIVNVSTNLEVYEGEGIIGITLYKNGEPTDLTNSFPIDPGKLITNPETKSYFIYEILSGGNVSFKKGDIISVYVTLSDGVVLKSITTTVQIIK
jgi:hypothetical protein